MRHPKWLACAAGNPLGFLYHWRKGWALTKMKWLTRGYKPPRMKWTPAIAGEGTYRWAVVERKCYGEWVWKRMG